MLEGWRRLRSEWRRRGRVRRRQRRRGYELRRRCRRAAADLRRIDGRSPAFLRDARAPIVVAVLRDEVLRLPAMLEHYRRLGFAGFVCVDNGSRDGTRELLEAQDDVVLYASDASFAAADAGTDWQQVLLSRFADGRWALVADADEQLVFPGDRETGVRGLIARAEARGEVAVLAPMIDVYPAGPVCDAVYRPGQPLLSVADRFDGPETHFARTTGEAGLFVELRGGARPRVMGFRGEEMPLLTKYPLARRGRGLALDSSHALFPARAQDTGTFAALLHFKFLHDFAERAEANLALGEHWKGSAEYRRYVETLRRQPRLELGYAGSRSYGGPESLTWLFQALGRLRVARPREFAPLA
jgi:hypothetical protein